jgi:glycosyltransferase involved in cell wall biosynthesis
VRILFAGHSLARPMGGGELSARTLLTRLAASHEVEALCAAASTADYVLDGRVRCRDLAVGPSAAPVLVPHHLAAMQVERRLRPALAQRVHEFRPDLLLLQSPAWLLPRDLPGGCRLVVFLRSLACYGVGEANPIRWRQLAGRPFRAARVRAAGPLLARADLVVSNSRFLQHALRTGAGLDSHVVPPFIDTPAAETPGPPGTRDRIAFVGLDRWKGAALALELADALPDRRFLFLAGARPSPDLVAQAGRRPNVTRLDWTPEMRPVFDRTRLLLMPSLWEEPFGRLPVEAGARGIPTLASARGGLPESVGEGGLLLPPDAGLAAWTRAIRDFDDEARYADASAAARAHAATFRVEATLARFAELVARELAVTL